MNIRCLRLALALMGGSLISCVAAAQAPDLERATEVEIFATRYYALERPGETGPGTIPLRDMQDRALGPALSEKVWCAAAIEGTVAVDGVVYNFAGTRDPAQATCSHKPSQRVRWKRSSFEFGAGNKANPLIPFRTIACDQGTVSGSVPWLDGGFAKFGQKIFVPAAVGAALPDGSAHDGLFECGDVGGAITGNHIDVFIGFASDAADARAKDPFPFTGGSDAPRIKAFVLPAD